MFLFMCESRHSFNAARVTSTAGVDGTAGVPVSRHSSIASRVRGYHPQT